MIDVLQIQSSLKWIHISNPSEEDFDYLIEHYKFHPLDIEDCRSKRQRPKIDVYDDYYFIILHFPYFDKLNRFLITKEVKIFWGANYIITVGKSHWVVRQLFNQAKEDEDLQKELLSGTSDNLLYLILEKLLSENFSIISRVGNEVELLNKELFNKKAEKTIERISITRKNIILLNTIIKPQLRLFHKFESGDIKGFAEDMEEYWGNILDSYQKTWDMIEDYAELIEGLSKAFDSLQTNKINEIMKVLTFFSSVMLPLTFITGFYGMNIVLPMQNNPNAFWLIVAILASITGGLIFIFKKRNWM